MNSIFKTIVLAAFLFFTSSVMLAQNPPHPNGGNVPTSGSGGNAPVGGGAPVGSGNLILIVLAVAYAGTKFSQQKAGCAVAEE